MATTKINETTETAQDFSARLFEIADGGYTSLSIAFGIKCGLFKVLVENGGRPMTSQEIADVAVMKERYVQEWLAAMASARIVDIVKVNQGIEVDQRDDVSQRDDVNQRDDVKQAGSSSSSSLKYLLPAHRARSFTPGTQEIETANLFKGIPVLSEVFNPMLEVIKKDGPREKGIRMLDVGCGTGFATLLLAERFPNSRFVGIDIREELIEAAKKNAEGRQLSNVDYVSVDGCDMPGEWKASFDYVFFFNVLHDAPRPDLIIEGVKRVMKPDGNASVIEFQCDSDVAKNIADPSSALLYTVSLFHCLPVSCQVPGSLGLGPLWGADRVAELLNKKGLNVKSVKKLSMIKEAHFFCELKG